MKLIDLQNVGWRAFIDRVTRLAGFPPPPNGAQAMKSTLDHMAAMVNEHELRLRALEGPQPEPEPEPTPTVRLAPRTYNLGSNDSDPRFCVNAPGVTQVSPGRFRDEGGYEYNADGLNSGGNWRDRNRMVPGLKPANEMDGRSACDPYGPFPPWPAESYLP